MAHRSFDGNYESWTECQEILPHAKEAMKSISDEDEDRLHVATIAYNCEWYLLLRVTYEEAEVMQRWALEAREKVLRREHPDTPISLSKLGLVLSSQGKYEDAEAMINESQKNLKRGASQHVHQCRYPFDFLDQHGTVKNPEAYAPAPENASRSAFDTTATFQQYQQAAKQQFHRKFSTRWDSFSACYMLGGEGIRNVHWDGHPDADIDACVNEELYVHSKMCLSSNKPSIKNLTHRR